MKKYFSLIMITMLLFHCSNKNNEQNIEKTNKFSSFPELISLGVDLRNDTLFNEFCRILNDSIQFKEESSIYFKSATGIFQDEKKVVFGFMPWGGLLTEDKNSFEITLKNKDTVKVNNSLEKISNIQQLIKDFLSQPDSICDCYETEYFEFFGNVEIPRRGITLSVNITHEKGLSITEWKRFFNVMYDIISIYKEKRNELSMNKWGKVFNSLDFEKKIAVTKRTNMDMFVVIDKDYSAGARL